MARKKPAAKSTEANPAPPDLRTWLATLETHDELRRIRAEVDWNQEIGAITRINLAQQGPGLLFENIRGYRNARCTKFLTGSLGNRRHVCLLLGLPLETTDRAIVAHLPRLHPSRRQERRRPDRADRAARRRRAVARVERGQARRDRLRRRLRQGVRSGEPQCLCGLRVRRRSPKR